MNFYLLVRPLLFLFPPEKAHTLSMALLKWIPSAFFKATKPPSNPIRIMGLHFENPIGLAAGFDKNGDYIDNMAKLGFGFIEVGTVTPKPQVGHPKPRLFRLKSYKGLINRMGFNNKGIDYCVERLKKHRYKGILGVNIGKNATTPLEKAVEDYLICFEKVYQYADYITLNISSPNTEGLRTLQAKDPLSHLLSTLKAKQKKLANAHNRYVPLVVKIAPDLTPTEIQSIGQLLLTHEIDGVIATNTTLSRVGVEATPLAQEKGGLSGVPITALSTRVISDLKKAVGDNMPIIGVGGIFDPVSAKAKLEAGASLLQVYTGLIYEGPGLLKNLTSLIDHHSQSH